MAGEIVLCVKVGDKTSSHGIKDGMIIDYLDPEDWNGIPPLSDHARKCFAHISVPRSWLGAIRDCVKPVKHNKYLDLDNVIGKCIKARLESLDNPISEIPVGIPPAEPTLKEASMLLYMALRNKRTQDSTGMVIYNDAGDPIAIKNLSVTPTTLTTDKMSVAP